MHQVASTSFQHISCSELASRTTPLQEMSKAIERRHHCDKLRIEETEAKDPGEDEQTQSEKEARENVQDVQDEP